MAVRNENKVLFLDDLHVGLRFTTATYAIDAQQIKAFAQEFDPQPFHLDEDAAKQTLFSGLVASGWHTAAITMRLMVQGGIPIAGGLIGAGVEVTWPKPVHPGSILQVTSEVLEARPSRSNPKRGLAKVRSETRDQFNDVVQVMVATMIVPRKSE